MKKILIPLMWLLSSLALAQTAQPTTADPVSNKRAVALSEELRCLVCQNQSIADSNAELAVDLRRQIREQIAQGHSDQQIVDYMVERYGDFVLYRPPLKATTLVLWMGPPLLFFLGLWLLLLYLRQRRSHTEVQPLSSEDRARAAALLGDQQGKQS